MEADSGSDILLYTTEDGKVCLDVTLQSDTVWLSLNQMSTLFQRDKSVISRHIRNIFDENELTTEQTVANFATVQTEGSRSVERNVDYYNLDVVISVGYRVKSIRGTQFRKWALQVLKEYMIKGFALDDRRLKQAGGGNYFDELLDRIRDIRSSEKVFWRKVLDLYATSIDYDKNAPSTVELFKTIQNKMHWAAHGHTAAEIIFDRVDAQKDFMGLTGWSGNHITREDITVAKNYLTAEELDALNKIVSAYLDVAEVQALGRTPMYMSDWLTTFDDFLRMTRRDILQTAGRVSHKQAVDKATLEYNKYRERIKNRITPVEQHFLEAIREVKQIQNRK
jgi:hypothetical protein